MNCQCGICIGRPQNPGGASPMNAMWSWWWRCFCRPGGCMCRCASVPPGMGSWAQSWSGSWWFRTPEEWGVLIEFTFGLGRPMMVRVYQSMGLAGCFPRFTLQPWRDQQPMEWPRAQATPAHPRSNLKSRRIPQLFAVDPSTCAVQVDWGVTRRCSSVTGASSTWTAWMIPSRPAWCPPSYVQKERGWRLGSPVVTWSEMSEAPWEEPKGWSCLRPQPKFVGVHMQFLCCLYISRLFYILYIYTFYTHKLYISVLSTKFDRFHSCLIYMFDMKVS